MGLGHLMIRGEHVMEEATQDPLQPGKYVEEEGRNGSL